LNRPVIVPRRTIQSSLKQIDRYPLTNSMKAGLRALRRLERSARASEIGFLMTTSRSPNLKRHLPVNSQVSKRKGDAGGNNGKAVMSLSEMEEAARRGAAQVGDPNLKCYDRRRSASSLKRSEPCCAPGIVLIESG
jgi:hypothetical protein